MKQCLWQDSAYPLPKHYFTYMTSSLHHCDLRAIKLEARRLIAIYPDSEVAELPSRLAVGGAQQSIGQTAAKAARMLLLGPIWSIPVERALDARSDKATGPMVFCATSDEVEKAGFILPGRRQLRTLYVMHPQDSNRYFPVANFHRLAFEDKFAELVRLLVALGATKVVVEHEHGWSREMGANATIPVPEEKATVGVTAKGSASLQSKIVFEASYEGKAKAQVPEDLFWYRDERTWQTLAEGRIKDGMESFSLKLVYNEDFDVDASLVAKTKDMSIELGGKFETHQATQWKISGEFRRARASKVV